MHVLAGPFLASALLLVVAGAGKLRDPMPLVRALRSARLPSAVALVRAAAAAEVVVGAAAVLVGGRTTAVPVALSYALFAAFVLLARARGGVLASCGCFGRADTPPTASHVVVTAAFAAVATGAAVWPLAPLPDLPVTVVPLLLVAAATVAVPAYLLLALLPGLRAAR